MHPDILDIHLRKVFPLSIACWSTTAEAEAAAGDAATSSLRFTLSMESDADILLAGSLTDEEAFLRRDCSSTTCHAMQMIEVSLFDNIR